MCIAIYFTLFPLARGVELERWIDLLFGGGGATSFLRNEFVFYVASDAIIIFYVCLPIHHIQSNLQNIMPPIATLLKLCIRNAYRSIEVHAQALGENLSIPTHP